jgi:hypothetical protein
LEWEVGSGLLGGAEAEVEAVGGALDAEGSAAGDVDVDHGGGEVPVAEELLDGADVGAVFEEVGGEGVAQGVAGGAAAGEGALDGWLDGLLDGALEDLFVPVVAAALAGGGCW